MQKQIKPSDCISGIYKIVNEINGKFYIGSSKNICNRLAEHLSRLRNNRHRNSYMQHSVNKYGIENFHFRILEEVEPENLIKREQYWIDNSNPDSLYNLSKEAGTGGGDIVRKRIYLLDLEGNIVKEYESGVALAKFFGRRSISYCALNTNQITFKKYRYVTVEFYRTNYEEIKSWNPFSSVSVFKAEQAKEVRKLLSEDNIVLIDKEGKEIWFSTIKSVSEYLNKSKERVRQIVNRMIINGRTNHKLKNSCFSLKLSKKYRNFAVSKHNALQIKKGRLNNLIEIMLSDSEDKEK